MRSFNGTLINSTWRHFQVFTISLASGDHVVSAEILLGSFGKCTTALLEESGPEQEFTGTANVYSLLLRLLL